MPETVEKPKNTPSKPLPPYKVLLHNDDKNHMIHVATAIIEITPLDRDQAIEKMKEAHLKGVSLLLVTHKERAELYQEQFKTKNLTVTIEPDEA